MASKTCRGCLLTKAVSEFYKDSRGGIRPRCKKCTAIEAERWRKANPEKHRAIYRRTNHRINIRKRFGLSEQQFAAIFERHGDRCAICGQPEARRRLSLDHCHKTGRLRGFLCSSCNLILGKVEDDPKTLRRAADYLENPPIDA